MIIAGFRHPLYLVERRKAAGGGGPTAGRVDGGLFLALTRCAFRLAIVEPQARYFARHFAVSECARNGGGVGSGGMMASAATGGSSAATLAIPQRAAASGGGGGLGGALVASPPPGGYGGFAAHAAGGGCIPYITDEYFDDAPFDGFIEVRYF